MRRRGLARARAVLEKHGVLLAHHGALPSVSSLVNGSPVSGSWWSHPRADDIFSVDGELHDAPDVLRCKLLDRKMTYVHTSLLSALLGVGAANDPWQREGLSPAARSLLPGVEKEGSLHTDALARRRAKPGPLVRELEQRLLVYTDEVHTEAGAHAKVVHTWEVLARKKRARKRLKPDVARRKLEEAVVSLYPEGSVRLPWQVRKRTARAD